ncbi:conjugal transfer protein TraG N-terminal domain-containing protein [Aeromonas caviae]|uniref:conjugal transfer protein TraG N-terminal domain-containing protein n=1 Tax=Aeromonas caviae TaxID=648 RepID=UPI002447DA4E|nr:conjugal transfer protein TraG N-terminal domain-containing protein [Aeromonas caviae]MDH0477392.1 conjugal transfer protein TraG N-terminal domain-containing protein [Aeromonas caviae]
METYNVYASGNFEMIVGAYNGLAMMVGDSNTMFVVAMILSLLMLMISALMKTFDDNQKPVHNFFFGLIMFLAFMSKVTVVVESRVTGQAQSVDNVPLLVALSGGIATGLFTDMTDDLRTAFSVVTPVRVDGTAMTTGYGGLDPLRALMKLNQEDYASSQICMMSGSVDLCATLEQYSKNCVGRDIITGGSGQEIKASALMNAAPEDTFLALKSTNTYWETPIIQKAGPDTTKTCAAAYTYISGLLSSSTFKNAVDVYNQQINLTDDEIGDATKIFTGTGISAYDMALQRLVWSATKKGLTDARDKVGLQVEQMMFTAKDQRLIKMASSYEMFNELAPAIITFFELFAIFIAPLMLIMLVTGRMGFMGIGSYIMFVLFTNMWPLIAVGVESYLNFALASNMSSSSSFGPAAMSWNGTPGVVEKAQTYLAVGSMMMTAIPALSMAVLFKGVQSMSGVSKQSTPDAPVNTHYVAPNIASAPDNGASKQGAQEAVWNQTAMGGTSMSGQSAYAATLNTGQAVRQEISHSLAGAKQEMAQAQASVGQSVSHMMEAGQQAIKSNQLSDSEAAKTQEGMNAMMQLARMNTQLTGASMQESLTAVASDARSVSQKIGASVSAGIKLPGVFNFGGEASIAHGITNTDTKSAGGVLTKTDSSTSGLASGNSTSTSLAALAEKSRAFTSGETVQNNKAMKDAAQNLSQSVKSYSESRSVVEQQSILDAQARNGALNSVIDIGAVGQTGKGFNAKQIFNELANADQNTRQSLVQSGVIDGNGELTTRSQERLSQLMSAAYQQSGGQLSQEKQASIASLGLASEVGISLMGGRDKDDMAAAGQLFTALNERSAHQGFQQLADSARQSVQATEQQIRSVTSDVAGKVEGIDASVSSQSGVLGGQVGSGMASADQRVNNGGIASAHADGKEQVMQYASEADQQHRPESMLYAPHTKGNQDKVALDTLYGVPLNNLQKNSGEFNDRYTTMNTEIKKQLDEKMAEEQAEQSQRQEVRE